MRSSYLIVCLIQIVCRPVFSQNSGAVLQPSCQSKIYCESEFLHDVQLAKIYPDSKTFVDKKLKYDESEILSKYAAFKSSLNGRSPTADELKQFIDEYMEDGDELEVWIPMDFTTSPSIATRVADPQYRRWAYDLNDVWKTLARRMKDDVKTNPDRYSLLWVPNGFCIPGGRFRELYYWDTYWIVKGLLLCDMIQTAKGVIDNIVYLVNKYGFMPNGSRVYYLNRSQPPMLILMVLSYYQKTNDFAYLQSILPILEAEFNFWMNNRMVTFSKDGKTHRMYHYNAPSKGPRPESYREDYESAQHFNTEDAKNDFYVKIKSGAETGWDFSSRWFVSDKDSNRGPLSDIQTPSIVPVDLNSILQANALALSVWFRQTGMLDKANKYSAISTDLLTSIQDVMWRADKGSWFDWDLINKENREYFFVSNLVPLWTESYTMSNELVAESVLTYLINQKIIGHDLSMLYQGTPTSMYVSSQQWDFPNAWPPLQAFIIQGLDRTQHKIAQEVAAKMADTWLRTNYKGFSEKRVMFEKYDVLAAGETGGGGEYKPQSGFGWTNGVVFEFLQRWGNTVSYAPNSE